MLIKDRQKPRIHTRLSPHPQIPYKIEKNAFQSVVTTHMYFGSIGCTATNILHDRGNEKNIHISTNQKPNQTKSKVIRVFAGTAVRKPITPDKIQSAVPSIQKTATGDKDANWPAISVQHWANIIAANIQEHAMFVIHCPEGLWHTTGGFGKGKNCFDPMTEVGCRNIIAPV